MKAIKDELVKVELQSELVRRDRSQPPWIQIPGGQMPD